jgi:hypothetical protein
VPRAWHVVPARHEHDGRRAASCSCPSCSCHFVLVTCCAGRAKWPCIFMRIYINHEASRGLFGLGSELIISMAHPI